MVLGLSVYDTQCGAKLFRVTRQTAALFDRPFRARWIFDVELLARMLAAAESDGDAALEELIYEYPLERWQDVAGSRLKSHDFFVAISDLAAIRWQYLSGKRARAVVSPAFVPQPARRDAA
jgi:hypothetical protein